MAAQPSSFLAGWNVLADELQLSIVRHAMPSDLSILPTFFDDKSTQGPYCREKRLLRFRHEVLPLVYCPAISAFAIEAFYSQNTLQIRCDNRMRLPPGSMRRFIRHIKVTLRLTSVGIDNLLEFDRVQSTFPGFHRVDISIRSNNSDELRPAVWGTIHGLETFRINARKLHVTFHHSVRRRRGRSVREYDEFEGPVMERFTLVGQILEQRVERFNITFATNTTHARQGKDNNDRKCESVRFWDVLPSQLDARQTKLFMRT